MDSLKFYYKNPKQIFIGMLYRFGTCLPDKLYLKCLFRLIMGYKLDLKSPKTFAEKCQWLKLYDRKPIYHQMVDKYEAKKLVAGLIGDEYVIPTYGIWNNIEDIDWDSLPDKFVIKPTHGGGSQGIVVCKDKSNFDKNEAKKKLSEAMGFTKIYKRLREWTFKGIKPRIIAEQLLDDGIHPYPIDYKIMCFNGVPKCFYVNAGRGGDKIRDTFFDTEGNLISDLYLKGYEWDENNIPELPNTYKKMLEIAGLLSQNVPHMRVDLYDIDGKIYFGEFTFAEESGFAIFNQDYWNKKLGDWIQLPSKINS